MAGSARRRFLAERVWIEHSRSARTTRSLARRRVRGAGEMEHAGNFANDYCVPFDFERSMRFCRRFGLIRSIARIIDSRLASTFI